VLAYALEFDDGIEFSRGGLSEPDEPAIAVRDLTGAITSWIEVGTPDPARLHKAAKASPRVAVYIHKDPSQFLARLGGERIHQAEAIEIWAIDRALLAEMAARLERRMAFSVSVTDRDLYICVGSDTLSGAVRRHPLG
jgi:uncharacterized protein YaeQ